MRAPVVQNMYSRAGEDTFFNIEYAKKTRMQRPFSYIYIYIYIYILFITCPLRRFAQLPVDCIHTCVKTYIYIYICIATGSARTDSKLSPFSLWFHGWFSKVESGNASPAHGGFELWKDMLRVCFGSGLWISAGFGILVSIPLRSSGPRPRAGPSIHRDKFATRFRRRSVRYRNRYLDSLDLDV